MDIPGIIDVFASAIVWHSTGDLNAGSKLLAALHAEDHEFSLLAECVLAEGGERSLALLLDGLESGAISGIEAARVVSAMWPKSVHSGNGSSFGAVGNA